MLVRMNPAMAELDALDRTADTDRALESTWAHQEGLTQCP
jgi:hypothetical protein